MYRFFVTAVSAVLLTILAAPLLSEDEVDPVASPQRVLERLVAIARLQPNPCLDRREAEASGANVPGDVLRFLRRGDDNRRRRLVWIRG